MKRTTTLLCALAVASQAAATQPTKHRAPGSVTDTLTVSVVYVVDVTAAFSEVLNLSLVTLGLTALPTVAGDAARLPASVSIPAAFPVKVDITPPAIPLTGLEFEGVAMITLDTENLPYSDDTRLRLFSAHNGGDFVDITEEVSEGSYRVRGSQGEFSEFMIVLDERDPADIVNTKFARVSSLLSTHMASIDSAVHATLSSQLSSAQTNWLADDVDAAKTSVTAFIATIDAATAIEIPNVWRSIEDVTNVAGILRAAAGTLHFSLEDARDTDLDGAYDFEDNCLLVANASQCDSNGDGYGNHCDADLDNNGSINSFDLTIMRAAFGATGVTDTDLNCNGITNTFDLSLMRNAFGGAPGPSAIAP